MHGGHRRHYHSDPGGADYVGHADCYLMELVATELPDVSDSVAGQWVYGHADCLDIINLEYLGINVFFCSISAVTGER